MRTGSRGGNRARARYGADLPTLRRPDLAWGEVAARQEGEGSEAYPGIAGKVPSTATQTPLRGPNSCAEVEEVFQLRAGVIRLIS